MAPFRFLSLVFALGFGLLLLGAQQPGSLDDLFVVLAGGRSLLEGAGGALLAGGQHAWGSTSTLDLILKACAGLFPDPLAAVWWLNTVVFVLACGVLGVLGVRLMDLGSEIRAPFQSAAVEAPAGPLSPGCTASGDSLQARTRGWGSSLTALALVAAPGLAEGSAYLLESSVWALCMGLVALGWFGGWGHRALGAALFALAWSRPEGALLALMLGVIRPRLLVPVLLALALEASWRYFAAGHVLSDTFFAKSSDNRMEEVRDGVAYLRAYLLTPAGGGVLLGLLLPWWGSGSSRGPARTLSILGIFALGLIVLAGGDGYLGARLLLPVSLLGVGCAGVLLGARQTIPARGALVALLLVFIPSAWSATQMAWSAKRGVRVESLGAVDFALEQEAAAALARASAVLDHGAVGMRDLQSLRWFEPRLPVRDASGLTDRAVSRSPAPGRVRHGRDAFVLLAQAGVPLLHLDHLCARPRPWAGMEVKQLLTDDGQAFIGFPRAAGDAEFLASGYVAASAQLSSGWLNVLVLSESAPKLLRAGFVLNQP